MLTGDTNRPHMFKHDIGFPCTGNPCRHDLGFVSLENRVAWDGFILVFRDVMTPS